jgi:hypothetical protein
MRRFLLETLPLSEVSLRHGFLPLRIGDYAFIEPHSPHRCAHQFGLDQDVPTFLLRPESLAADLEGLGWCYSHLFRLGTGSHFQTVPVSRASTFSRRYIWWYYNVIRSYQSYTPSVVTRSTCPRGRGSSSSSFSHDDLVPFPPLSLEPVDFQGLDSRCPCSSTRTRLTGTFQIHLFPSLGFRSDFDRFFFDQILLMSMTRRSPDSRSLARELVEYMPSHLSSHLLQPPWREVRTALLGYLPHSSFLLLLRVILFTDLPYLT